MRSLDVSVWNLVWPLAALAACGPVVGVEDSQSGTSEATETDPTEPTNSTNPTEPTGGAECQDSSDCPYGYVCNGGFCEYECYCGCGGEPPPAEHRFRCSEAGGYECYEDLDCGEGFVCQGGYCVTDPDPPCDAIPTFEGEIAVEFGDGSGPIVGLEFNAIGWEDDHTLFGIRGNDVFRADGGGASDVLEHDAPFVAFVPAVLDDDGVVDLVTAEQAETPTVRVWLATVGGQFEQVGEAIPMDAQQLAVGELHGDGRRDVFARNAEGIWLIPGLGGGAFDSPEHWLIGSSNRFGIVDIEGDARHDFASDDIGVVSFVFGPGGERIELGIPAGASAAVGVHGADFDGDGREDLVVANESGMVTSLIGTPLDYSPYTSSIGASVIGSAAADVDGDGRADLVLGRSDGSITIRFGASAVVDVGYGEPFGCETTIPAGVAPWIIAVGDHDDDGDRDIAISDGNELRVLLRS